MTCANYSSNPFPMFPPYQSVFGGACAYPVQGPVFSTPNGPWSMYGGGYYPGWYNSCYPGGCPGGMNMRASMGGPQYKAPQKMFGPQRFVAPMSPAAPPVDVGDVYEAVVVNGEAPQTPYAGGRGLLLDVRTPAEYAQGSVPGAINLPVAELANYRNAIIEATGGDPDYPILIYCKLGVRAQCAQDELRSMGFRNVQNVGGMQAGPLAPAMRAVAQPGRGMP